MALKSIKLSLISFTLLIGILTFAGQAEVGSMPFASKIAEPEVYPLIKIIKFKEDNFKSVSVTTSELCTLISSNPREALESVENLYQKILKWWPIRKTAGVFPFIDEKSVEVIFNCYQSEVDRTLVKYLSIQDQRERGQRTALLRLGFFTVVAIYMDSFKSNKITGFKFQFSYGDKGYLGVWSAKEGAPNYVKSYLFHAMVLLMVKAIQPSKIWRLELMVFPKGFYFLDEVKKLQSELKEFQGCTECKSILLDLDRLRIHLEAENQVRREAHASKSKPAIKSEDESTKMMLPFSYIPPENKFNKN